MDLEGWILCRSLDVELINQTPDLMDTELERQILIININYQTSGTRRVIITHLIDTPSLLCHRHP